jgi:hypothetical protein
MDRNIMKQAKYNQVDQILIPHTALATAIKRVGQCFNASQDSTEPICIALIGESRTGKSRALEYFESSHQRTRSDDGLIVPILRVRSPSNPTAKGLAEDALRALGDPCIGRSTETNLTARLITLLNAAQTNMLMIDEFQQFYDKTSHKVMHHVADWLKVVVDESKVALVVSGLPSCQAVLNQNEQLAGRFLSPIRMPRFDWQNEDSREEFIAILGAFQEGLQNFDFPDLASDEMAFRFYCATGGLIGYVAKILRQVVWDAIDDDTKIITLGDLAIAHHLSVYTDEKADDLPMAFAPSFVAQPNKSLLKRVQDIGIATPEELPVRRIKSTTESVTLSKALRK